MYRNGGRLNEIYTVAKLWRNTVLYTLFSFIVYVYTSRIEPVGKS